MIDSYGVMFEKPQIDVIEQKCTYSLYFNGNGLKYTISVTPYGQITHIRYFLN